MRIESAGAYIILTHARMRFCAEYSIECYKEGYFSRVMCGTVVGPGMC